MATFDDPNGNLRRSETPNKGPSYTGWLVGGAVALAVCHPRHLDYE
jgi:hypothetical protein